MLPTGGVVLPPGSLDSLYMARPADMAPAVKAPMFDEPTWLTGGKGERLGLILFERLFNAMKDREAKDGIKRTVTLDQQYRMHPILGSFVSDTFYAPYGEGFASPRRAEEFVHDLPGYAGRVAAWIDMPLSRGREHGGQSKRRTAEAEWIAKEVERLATARRDLSFGVISFYAAQADEALIPAWNHSPDANLCIEDAAVILHALVASGR
jgi:hypothetical protein